MYAYHTARDRNPKLPRSGFLARIVKRASMTPPAALGISMKTNERNETPSIFVLL